MSSAKLDATGHRWVEELPDYNFTIKYRPGKMNVDANVLSKDAIRRGQLHENLHRGSISGRFWGYYSSGQGTVQGLNPTDNSVIGDATTPEITPEDLNVKLFSPQKIKEVQHKDTVISRVIHYKFHGARPNGTQLKHDPCDVNTLVREWNKLEIDGQGILRRRTSSNLQLVLPKEFIPLVLKELHVEMGHLGVDRVVDLARSRF